MGKIFLTLFILTVICGLLFAIFPDPIMFWAWIAFSYGLKFFGFAIYLLILALAASPAVRVLRRLSR